MSAPYPPPLHRLLTLGDAWKMQDWPDYVALGLGPEHIPDLIRLATDPALNDADSDSPEVWGPGHAWRALAQLHAGEAAAPLTGLFRRIDEDQDDFVGEELPVAFGVLGPAAIGPLVAYLADKANGLWARTGAANGLGQIAVHHPDARADCVAALVNQLGQFSDQDPVLNGSLVADLVDLKAVEAAPVIEQAFAADRVDEMAVGDWEDVQIKFGLKDRREKPRRPPQPGTAAAALQQLADALKQPKRRPLPSKSEIEARAERAVLEQETRELAGPKRKHHRKPKK